jgi:hypothetical protein
MVAGDSEKYLGGKLIVDELLADADFLELAQNLILTKKGSSEYNSLYTQLDAVVKGITSERTVVVKSDGSFYYDSNLSSSQAILVENHNTRPEIMASVNFLWGNPMINKTSFPIRKIYPLELGPTIAEGYGLANRLSSTSGFFEYNVAKTHSDSLSPLNAKVFTVRVSVE